jgi:hypothetical protein
MNSITALLSFHVVWPHFWLCLETHGPVLWPGTLPLTSFCNCCPCVCSSQPRCGSPAPYTTWLPRVWMRRWAVQVRLFIVRWGYLFIVFFLHLGVSSVGRIKLDLVPIEKIRFLTIKPPMSQARVLKDQDSRISSKQSMWQSGQWPKSPLPVLQSKHVCMWAGHTHTHTTLTSPLLHVHLSTAHIPGECGLPGPGCRLCFYCSSPTTLAPLLEKDCSQGFSVGH